MSDDPLYKWLKKMNETEEQYSKVSQISFAMVSMALKVS
jgi:hypothetical protein